MKKANTRARCIHLPKVRWKWILSWFIIQPFAAAPLVMMVGKFGPFKEPFIANGPVVLPAMLLAVAAMSLLIHGSGLLDPVPRDD
jgi:hypothetical protein